MTATEPGAVTVAVITYRRADPLRNLLTALVDQRTVHGTRPSVLVVDNDVDGSAEPVVRAAAGLEVRYVHEPRPGISAARNAALDAVPAGLLVFVDDDEEPGEGWLAALTACWERYRDDGGAPLAGVVGPVVSRWPGEPDPWLVAGRFFERRRPATGTEVDVAATNNLLLDLAVVGDLRFDEEFGLSGGSDTLFTRRLTGAGHRLVWCAEAPVTDVVPVDRLTRGWVLRRAMRTGNSWSRCELLVGRGPRLRRRVVLLAGGAARAVVGAGRWGVGVVTGSLTHRARGARTAARGAGLVTGALGHVVSEYRRPASAGRG